MFPTSNGFHWKIGQNYCSSREVKEKIRNCISYSFHSGNTRFSQILSILVFGSILKNVEILFFNRYNQRLKQIIEIESNIHQNIFSFKSSDTITFLIAIKKSSLKIIYWIFDSKIPFITCVFRDNSKYIERIQKYSGLVLLFFFY